MNDLRRAIYRKLCTADDTIEQAIVFCISNNKIGKNNMKTYVFCAKNIDKLSFGAARYIAHDLQQVSCCTFYIANVIS